MPEHLMRTRCEPGSSFAWLKCRNGGVAVYNVPNPLDLRKGKTMKTLKQNLLNATTLTIFMVAYSGLHYGKIHAINDLFMLLMISFALVIAVGFFFFYETHVA